MKVHLVFCVVRKPKEDTMHYKIKAKLNLEMYLNLINVIIEHKEARLTDAPKIK